MRFNKFILLGVMSTHLYAYDYKVCHQEKSIHCDKTEVQQASEKINENIKETKEILFKEVVKQRVLKYLDQHLKNIESIENCLIKDNLTKFCDEELRKIKKSNSEMRINLGLRDPKRLVDHYNNRTEDKVRRKISHLSFMAQIKLEPLTDKEVEVACDEFDQIRDAYFKEHNITEKMKKSFSGILMYQKAIKEIKKLNLNNFQEKYLSQLREEPFLKFLKSSDPSHGEVLLAMGKYKNELYRKREALSALNYKQMDSLLGVDELVEAILKDNPIFCDVATTMRDFIEVSDKTKNKFIAALVRDYKNQ